MDFLSSIMVNIAIALIWRTIKLNIKSKSFVKYVLLLIFTFVAVVGSLPLMIFLPPSSRNGVFFVTFMRILAPYFELKFNIEGQENIVKKSGCIVLMNHQSIVDVFTVSHLWPNMENFITIAKKSIFFIPVLGMAAWHWGTLFTPSGSNPGQDISNTTEELMVTKKAHILLFPEGTRNLEAELLPFKSGSFHLAVDAQVPIQPVAVSRYKFLKNWNFESGTINVRILPAIPTIGCTKDDIPKLIDEAYKVMSENIKAISSDNK